MKKKTKLMLVGVIGVVLAGCGFFALNSKKKESPYHVFTVKAADPLQLKGKVEPLKKQLYFFDGNKGRIKNIPVSNGEVVAIGTPLIEYQNEAVENETVSQRHAVEKSSLDASQAEATVAANERQVQTITNQINDTQQKMAQAKEEEKTALNEQLKQQQGELQTANDQLSQSRFAVQSAYEDVQSAKDVLAGQQKQASSTVSSEIAGIASVDEKGEGSPEVPVVAVSSKEKQVKGIVTEYDLDKLVPGQTVQVTTVGNDKKVDGTIKSIATSALPTSGDNSNVASYEFIVEGDFPWTDDLSTLVTLQQNQLLLPDSAIKKTKNEKYVYKYVNGKVKKTAIQIVTVSGHNIVQKGLKANDKIIENPDDELKDGSEIQVAAND
ncbi:efflux RND transporter periplasmic adaptor subunit [Enterococcus avium]|uniref:Efflux RND transporter periplasmic adaptor subunit n=1 Tax=Enterococcus avium TaxID=33945 RepID=A0ABD5FEH6_ENTAV|nr:efflux RND transporter periplasmic adaptor subunit [Enterococcus avium]MDT2396899.1 efflux RND transporter periplasmic adaptor subunit [Enterococcus avium]MDT2435912.1 efflux RND transporter periplasmic adaptor subunit [Enterococcus avium]MDT2447138.1 efflux RND transporter periplasmic adaptor subunit [Enterococcus avium]MDT2465881.1 efflux RND transporter periplasmic adaptor subunit [Enterococcus avium]MDT2483027.1 efflux RND transporter periplasmic adaptor subunit [Enterococcus avium]